jgi:hypothetical protein
MKVAKSIKKSITINKLDEYMHKYPFSQLKNIKCSFQILWNLDARRNNTNLTQEKKKGKQQVKMPNV